MPEKNPFYGATFAERKKLRDAESKQVDAEADEVEDKSLKRTRAAKKS